MNIEDILAPMRKELSAMDRAPVAKCEPPIEWFRRRDELRVALRINEQFIRAALRNKETVS
jgi:hypothetical protein